MSYPCKEHKDCTGCGACIAICPMNCITMQPDEHGFLFPQINKEFCNDCELCVSNCPGNSQAVPQGQPLAVHAAWHKDDQVRKVSSSGGIFTALAEYVIEQGGVVIGAAFSDKLTLEHIIVDNKEELARLRGSKYVQSRIDRDVWLRIENYLEAGVKVLFTGTPCQIAGLNNCLSRIYDNLFCLDILCHGVPSPLLLDKYLGYLSKVNSAEVVKVNFRDKSNGWKSYQVSARFSNQTQSSQRFVSDPYMVAFLKDYALRESCYRCKYARTSRVGDITLADYWGVAKRYPAYDKDDKGTSLLLVNTEKGRQLLAMVTNSVQLYEGHLGSAIVDNPILTSPACRSVARDRFYNDLLKMSFNEMIEKYKLREPSFFSRMADRVVRKIKRLARI